MTRASNEASAPILAVAACLCLGLTWGSVATAARGHIKLEESPASAAGEAIYLRGLLARVRRSRQRGPVRRR